MILSFQIAYAFSGFIRLEMDGGIEKHDKISSQLIPEGEQMDQITKFSRWIDSLNKMEPIETKSAELAHFHRRSIASLYMWFETKQALIMLLTNTTLQIDFKSSQTTVSISPETETIAFGLRRLKFRDMAFQRLSEMEFQQLKYATAVAKYLGAHIQQCNTSLIM